MYASVSIHPDYEYRYVWPITSTFLPILTYMQLKLIWCRFLVTPENEKSNESKVCMYITNEDLKKLRSLSEKRKQGLELNVSGKVKHFKMTKAILDADMKFREFALNTLSCTAHQSLKYAAVNEAHSAHMLEDFTGMFEFFTAKLVEV